MEIGSVTLIVDLSIRLGRALIGLQTLHTLLGAWPGSSMMMCSGTLIREE
jgi:hypothetical protein